jgi:glycosyltransferase involved in cell wall biosynthesis
MTGSSHLSARRLYVTRGGGDGSGGGVGHSWSRGIHVPLLGGDAACQTHVLNLPGGIGPLRKMKTLWRLKKGHLSGVHEISLRDYAEKVERLRPEAVLLDSTLFGPLAPAARALGARVVTQSYNCEFDFYAGEAALRGGLAGELMRGAYLAEELSLRQSDLVLSLTDYDTARFRQLYDADCPIVTFNPILALLREALTPSAVAAVDVDRAGRRDRGEDPYAVFLGSAGHQNRRACLRLAQTWRGDHCRLLILGKVGQWLRETVGDADLRRRRIEIMGFLPSLSDTLQGAVAMVCPMTLGSGMKVKILDALAHGLPALVSEEASHGFEFAQATGHVRICSTQAMEAAAAGLVKEPLSVGRLARSVGDEMALQRQTLLRAYASLGLEAGP